MASNLDLEEQEQIDQLKAFWKQYGNLITTTLTLVLVAFAAWNGWNWWQRDQATKASVVFEQVDQALQAGQPDRAAKLFDELKSRYGRAAVAGQAGLMLARVQADKQQTDAAQTTLEWVAGNAHDEGHRALAHLRLASLLMDKRAWSEAAKQLDAVEQPEFKALVDDRRGDLALAQGKPDEAVRAWTQAWQAMDASMDYRRVIDAKLTAQAAAPSASQAAEKATP